MKMIHNPEFIRNIWLELTPHRLLSMPLVLGIYFFLLFVLGGYHLNHDDAEQALFIAALLTLLWGAYMTAESVLTEVRDNTWDAQRMSAMPAWRLVWGKLIGSSIFSWYGASICFLVFIAASNFDMDHAIKMVLLYLLAALLAQATSMLLALLLIRKKGNLKRSHAIVFTLLGALTGAQFLAVAGHGGGHTNWFGQSFLTLEFTLVALLFWLSWSWLACQRLMRAELQSPNGIWTWIAFVICLILFSAGFLPLEYVFGLLPYIALSFTIILCYFMLFSEAKDPVMIGRLLNDMQRGDWKNLQYGMPCWLITVILMLLMTLFLPFARSRDIDPSGMLVDQLLNYFSPQLLFTAVLFVLRDMCIVLWLNFSPQLKRADLAAMLYLAISYGLLPMIALALGFNEANILFFPIQDGGLTGVLLVAAEVMLFGWLMVLRWQMNFAHNKQKNLA